MFPLLDRRLTENHGAASDRERDQKRDAFIGAN